MSELNGMASQQQPRPPYPSRPSYSPNAMSPPPFPPNTSQYGSQYHYPPPQQNQPPAKRMRMSPDPESPQNYSRQNQLPSPNSAGSPTTSFQNGIANAPPVLMGPPSRPTDRPDERYADNNLSYSTASVREGDQRQTIPPSNFYGDRRMSNNFPAAPGASDFGKANAFAYQRPAPASNLDGVPVGPVPESPAQNPMNAEELRQLKEQQANYEAANHSQYPTWDMFLAGDEVQQRLQKQASNEHLKTNEGGLMRPNRHFDPQPTRVDGREGASRVINLGQTFLAMETGKDIRSILDLVCLSAKERLSGVLDLAARLARERKQHSRGVVPTEYSALAVFPPAVAESAQDQEPLTSSPSTSGLKRTHSQANNDNDAEAGKHRMTELSNEWSQVNRSSESARTTKRQKRNNVPATDSSQANEMSGIELAASAQAETDRRVTKKDRKIAETKFTEQQLHKSANETARLAMSGLGGRLGGKKKNYSWMNAGGTGTSTPTKAPTSAAAPSGAATPATEKPAAAKTKAIGVWTEDNDVGIQARDVLLVLENDGRASRSFVRGSSKPEG